MDTPTGKIKSEEYANDPVIPGNKTVWFLNGDLVRPYHYSRSTGLITVYNINKDRLETCLLHDFKKNRERAYTIAETARLVNRHRKYMPRLVKRGIIPKATGSKKDGETGWQIRSYYSESQVKEIRDALASIHIGQPRKDGLVTNNMTPNRQELTHRMGDGILTYTRTADGRFIPVWKESI
jgi:hypothetical protein